MISAQIVRMAGGDEAATEEVDAFCRPRILAYFRRFVDQDVADDLAQITLLKVWKNAASYMPQRNAMTWVLSISHRVLIDHFRSDARRHRLAVESVDWIETVHCQRESDPGNRLERM